MEDQCLMDSFLTDSWESTAEDLTFLCSKPTEQGIQEFTAWTWYKIIVYIERPVWEEYSFVMMYLVTIDRWSAL